MNFTIITAGGKGLRMGSELPKQFLPLNGKPILMHTIDAFASCGVEQQIILVLPSSQIIYWQNLCQKHSFEVKHKIVEGGEERFFSVKNALDIIPAKGITAIHDGVRPLVSRQTIINCFKKAKEKGAAIPYSDITESIRKVSENGNEYADRNSFKLIATPQCFRTEIVKTAYNQTYSSSFTDSASVVAKMGQKITLVKGNPENIKITTQTDLLIAKAFLDNIQSPTSFF